MKPYYESYIKNKALYESLKKEPEYDCYNKGYRYVVAILTDECDVLDVDVIGF